MSIELDWEFESDDGWEMVKEDPDSLKARRRATQRVWLVICLAVMLIGAGIYLGFWRMGQIEEQMQVNLEDTIAAETLAIRFGDQRTFLKVQADIEEWERSQTKRLAVYKAYGPRIDVSGEVVEMVVDGDDARVVMLEILDGEEYHITWFYHHDDTGWHHVPSKPEYWGETLTRDSTYFTITYNTVDENFVDALAPMLDAHVEAVCSMGVCAEGLSHRRIPLEITLDGDQRTGWSKSAYGLIMFSPHLNRVPADGSVKDIRDDRIANLIDEQWQRIAFEQSYPGDISAELRENLNEWYFDQTTNAIQGWVAPLYLGERVYGDQFVPDLLTRIRFGMDERLATLSLLNEKASPSAQARAIHTIDQDSISDEDLAQQILTLFTLEYLLSTDTIIAGGNIRERTTIRDLFLAQKNSRPHEVTSIQSLIDWTNTPESFRIAVMWRAEDQVMARIDFETNSRWNPDHIFVYYQIIDGQLYRTDFTQLDKIWGEQQTIEEENYSITFYEIDRDFAEQISTSLDEGLSLLSQDFGIPLSDGEKFKIEIFISEEMLDATENALPDPPDIFLLSPYAYSIEKSSRATEDAMEDVQYHILGEIFYSYLNDLFEDTAEDRATEYIFYVVEGYEGQRINALMGEDYAIRYGIVDYFEWDGYPDLARIALEELWDYIHGFGDYTDYDYDYSFDLLHEASHYVLFDVIIEQYGDESLSRLYQTYLQAESSSDWLKTALSIDDAEVDRLETLWRARVIAIGMGDYPAD